MENQDLMNTIEGQTTELNQEGQPDNQVRDGENAAAMIVAIDKGKLPVQIRIAGRRKFGYKEESDPHYMNDADCACEIYRDGDDYIYRDHLLPGMTMYNGKQIGGHELEGARQVQLREGDILSFRSPEGETKMRFLFHRIYDPDNVWQTADLHPEAGRYIICKHEEKTDDRELSEARSANLPKHYAELALEDGVWHARDHSTIFGVYVNNVRVQDHPLSDMDIVRIGNTFFVLDGGSLVYNHKTFLNGSLSINIEERAVWNMFKKKTLLKDIDMKIFRGEMVLILGGSGAGKTTFINAVMGYEKARGQILAGDVNVYQNYDQMKYRIGFVPQQDLLRLEDTVYDTLENAASLKLPTSITDEQRETRIKEVLAMFGLETEAGNLVGKLSGGQRKRLSIAVEYIADPSLFFLDEPDSGLDGVMARSLMDNLRKIADEEKIILVITHSPDRVSDIFDKIIVLAKSEETGTGRLAFYGGIDEARDFFGTDSMEGIVKKVNRKDEGGEGLADYYVKKVDEISD